MSMRKQTAAALGLFDGVHEGHRAVLRAAYRQKEKGLIPGVFTFRSEMAAQKRAQGYLYTTEQKLWMMEQECGMEQILAPAFEQVCGLSGEEFVQHILLERMHAAYVCCGRDFRFGRGAKWNADDLLRIGRRYGIMAEIVDDRRIGGETVSSSEIRELLLHGELDKANELLGKPYFLRGTVEHGAHLGSTIGFPTANLLFGAGQLVPKYGVYVSETRTPDGIWRRSVTNIGVKPTVKYEGMPLAETYIDGYDQGDLYGETLEVALRKRLREEMRFHSVEALICQMEKDLAVCRQLSLSYHHSDTLR